VTCGWGYAACDAAVGKHVDAALVPADHFRFLQQGCEKWQLRFHDR